MQLSVGQGHGLHYAWVLSDPNFLTKYVKTLTVTLTLHKILSFIILLQGSFTSVSPSHLFIDSTIYLCLCGLRYIYFILWLITQYYITLLPKSFLF